jgi:hypothetical protein
MRGMISLVVTSLCSAFISACSNDPPLTGGWICCEHSNGCTSGPVADQQRAVDACVRTGGKASTDSSLSCVDQKCVKG